MSIKEEFCTNGWLVDLDLMIPDRKEQFPDLIIPVIKGDIPVP